MLEDEKHFLIDCQLHEKHREKLRNDTNDTTFEEEIFFDILIHRKSELPENHLCVNSVTNSLMFSHSISYYVNKLTASFDVQNGLSV